MEPISNNLEQYLQQTVDVSGIQIQLTNNDQPDATRKNIPVIKNVSNFINDLLLNSDKFNEFICKTNINISESQTAKIKNILKDLYIIDPDNASLNNIINELTTTISDGKVELYEIPSLVSMLYDIFIGMYKNGITPNDICLLIKIMLLILVETGVLHITTNEYMLIIKSIDVSITLLSKQFSVSKINFNKCICF